ncbi:hypothetical protein [Roseomonas indoligenes]|uniref:Uncharacterized protein n=1 Tax=Roseomonas indoligenes TaxID=2820811 RepID=A0A940N669_9PROT|nr:hypothetical protein [Pararoseomonas indoligenes]MBP0495845.1 hypothetical protein [Pararoseomonas indoligenes]
MRLIRLAVALLIPVQLILVKDAPARGTTSPARAEVAVEPRAPSEQDILFAYHRMRGTEPDFGALAVTEVDSRPPPPQRARDPERERRYLLVLAERRLRANFAAFDLDRSFRIHAAADVLGYDAERGGIPLRTGVFRGISMRDATDGERGFTLRFRNPDAIRAIPAADSHAAGALLQNAGLASLGNWAGPGVLVIDFVFAGTVPALPELKDTPVLAEITSARVETREGRPLHSFASVGSRSSAAAMRRAGFPPLLGAELTGIRIGMPPEEARRLALQGHPQALASGFFSEARQGAADAPRCSRGLVADIRAFNLPLAPKDSYAACIAFTAGDGDGGLSEVTWLRFLPGTTPALLREDLEREHGMPEEPMNGGILWLGRDPERKGLPELLELRADMAELQEGGPEREPGTLLALTLRRLPLPAEDGG